MTVQNFDLGHHKDDLLSVVWLLGQGVAEEIELFKECKFWKVLQEDVEITQLVVANQENLKEFISSNALNILQLIVLTVKLFNAEVRRDVVQVL